jgi:hypothetical protein
VRRVLGLIGMPVKHPGADHGQHYPCDPAALADRPEGWLIRQSRRALEESRRTCELLAGTEEKLAATLARMTELRPHAAGRLGVLSQQARQHAATIRHRTRAR